MSNIQKKRSLRKNLQLSFLLVIGIMIIPSIYSVILLQLHINQYDNIITNVNQANIINNIAKTEIPNELWEIICGKKSFSQGQQYLMIKKINDGITQMKNRSKSTESLEKLEVAARTSTTLSKNVQILQNQIESEAPVTENEATLEEIRTITSLFSDIMEDFIISEIESANITNNAIKRSSMTLTILQLAIVIISLFFAINGYLFVSESFGKPLADMQNLSNEIAHGNLNARTSVPDVIELEPLAQNMNAMAEQINLLIQKNIEEQKNFQKAEMKALQAQITPHFLYNTFDTIIWLAEEEDTQRVVQITKAFSEFLRISLSKGHEWITIRQELDHIKNYLTIQKIRYADILNYQIDADEELMEYKTIKLVLQPLIENAIYHGIKNKRGRGHIKVSIHFEDDTKTMIKVTVEDDGAGFSEERLSEVRNELKAGSLSEERLSSVYGLYNVHKKLQLYYGDKTNGIEIESEQNKGSTISFKFPCIKQMETDNV